MPLIYVEFGVHLAFLFALGAVLGSLLNVCIYRLPLTEEFWPALRSLVYPPSRCPGCGTFIRFYDNVPIFGWLKLRGRCRVCRRSISVRYPLIELLTALLFVLFFWFEVPTYLYTSLQSNCLYHPLGPQGISGSSWFSPHAILYWRYAFHMVLVFALIAATFIDFDLRIIPDTVTLPAMLVGVLGNWLTGQVYLVPVWFHDPRAHSYLDSYRFLLQSWWPQMPGWVSACLTFKGVPAWVIAHPHWHGLAVSLAGILIGGGVVWAVRLVGYWALKREAMGFGDVVLLAMIGSFLGWQATLVIFFLAPIIAIGVAILTAIFRREREIPYGPYLSLATVLLLLGWQQIWPAAEERIFALGPFLPVVAAIMFVSLFGLLLIMRGVQHLLGFNTSDEMDDVTWRPGDQLAYLAGQHCDSTAGQWPQEQWAGTLSGRGMVQYRDWRHSGSSPAHQRWQSSRPPNQPGQ